MFVSPIKERFYFKYAHPLNKDQACSGCGGFMAKGEMAWWIGWGEGPGKFDKMHRECMVNHPLFMRNPSSGTEPVNNDSNDDVLRVTCSRMSFDIVMLLRKKGCSLDRNVIADMIGEQNPTVVSQKLQHLKEFGLVKQYESNRNLWCITDIGKTAMFYELVN